MSTGQPPSIDFAALFRSHAKAVLRTLRRLGVEERDLEDVAQEVFLTLHAKLAEIRNPAATRAFLFGIVARHASDHRKSARVRRERPGEVPERAGSAPQLSEIVARERRLRLDRALDALDGDKRTVFVLFEVEELSMREIADALDVPLQTAYARLYAARKALSLALRELAPAAGGGGLG